MYQNPHGNQIAAQQKQSYETPGTCMDVSPTPSQPLETSLQGLHQAIDSLTASLSHLSGKVVTFTYPEPPSAVEKENSLGQSVPILSVIDNERDRVLRLLGQVDSIINRLVV